MKQIFLLPVCASPFSLDRLCILEECCQLPYPGPSDFGAFEIQIGAQKPWELPDITFFDGWPPISVHPKTPLTVCTSSLTGMDGPMGRYTLATKSKVDFFADLSPFCRRFVAVDIVAKIEDVQLGRICWKWVIFVARMSNVFVTFVTSGISIRLCRQCVRGQNDTVDLPCQIRLCKCVPVLNGLQLHAPWRQRGTLYPTFDRLWFWRIPGRVTDYRYTGEGTESKRNNCV